MAANYASNSLHVPQRVRVRSFACNYLAILTAKTLRSLKARIFRWFLTRLSAGVLEVHQVKARRKGRKRPPLGLLVIAKLTLYIFPLHFATIFHRNYVNLRHADYIFTKLFYHFTAKITTVESVLVHTSILTDFFSTAFTDIATHERFCAID